MRRAREAAFRVLVFSAVLATACGFPRHLVVLAFPRGGDAGADGLRAAAAASGELRARGYDVEPVDLDSGERNPHLDEGTDDERAAARAAMVPQLLAGRPNVAGVIVGPTRAIADAVPWRKLRIPVVAVAPLVHDIPCACRNEADARRADPAVLIEAPDGARWTDAAGRTHPDLRAAAADRAAFDVVDRRGFAYRVPASSRRALLAYPGALDRRDFSASALGLDPFPVAPTDTRAVRAVTLLVRELLSRP